MARKITKLGHAVKGALAAYIAPRFAADQAFKPRELAKLLNDVKPAPFKEQRPLITAAVKTAFDGRLAQDVDPEELEELLEELEEAGEGEGDYGEDDDLDTIAMDDPAEHGKALMELLSGLQLPPDTLDKINEHINAMCAKPAGMDEFPPAKPKETPAPNAAPMKEAPSMKPALDRKTVDEIVNKAVAEDRKNTQAHLASLYDAAAKVRPYVGEINVLACDSAASVFKLALDAHNIPTKDVHPSAYESLLQLINRPSAPAPVLAVDAADAQDFEKRYTNIPARA